MAEDGQQMAKNRDLRLWAGSLVILLAALLYLVTLDTGLRPDELSGGDLITHQYAQVQARPSNAPGYPLYTMGGWLWYRLARPVQGWVLNPVQQLSSYSTLWALLSLYLLYRLILKISQDNWPVAALSAAFYATTYFFWFYSVTTEQYTSAVFQTLLIVWLAFKWDDTGANHYLLWMAFIVGTCLANLVTTLLIVPPLLWFTMSRQPYVIRQPSLVLGSILLALLPVTSYSYVYARGAAHPEWRGAGQWTSTWAWFLDFITTRQGRDELAPGLNLASLVTHEFPALIWGELTWVVLIGGLVGLSWLGRRQAILLYSTLLIYLLFSWVDRFGNWFQVIIPAYPLVVLGFAAGVNALWSRGWSPSRQKPLLRGLILLGLGSLVAYRLTTSLPRADQSYRSEDTGLDPGWSVLSDQPPANSIIVGDHGEWRALDYLTTIWGVEPSLDPRPLCDVHPAEIAESAQALSGAKAIYLTRRAAAIDPACLADEHRYAAGANLIQVQSTPNTRVPESARRADLDFGPMLLVGFEAHLRPSGKSSTPFGNTPVQPRITWRLSLHWQARDAIDSDYTVSVRPLRNGAPFTGADAEPLIQDHQPVWNSYPTSRWLAGEVVRDDYVLSLPDDLIPTSAQIVIYRSTALGFENLAEAELNLATDSVR
jgi:hypothetical protein